MMTAQITTDERGAMRWRADNLAFNPLPTPTESAYSADVPRLLDALDAAEAEVARLREGAETLRGWITEHEETIIETADALDEATRRAPAWDEDAVTDKAIASARAALVQASPSQSTPWVARLVDEIVDSTLAVVRRHLPVKPSREDVVELLYENRAGYLDDLADAVLALWPGKPLAQAQAEALTAWKTANTAIVEAVALLGGTFGESLREVLAIDPKGETP